MKIIDLTMPLYEDQAAQNGHMGFRAHPVWPRPFTATETRSYDPNGSRFHVYTIFCEPGTRCILSSFRAPFKDEVTLDTLDMNKLVMRDAVILDIPKRNDEIVEPEEVEAAFKKAPYQKGDALLVRTGWGDDERYFKMGHNWRLSGPHFNSASSEKILDIMEQNGTDMYLYDLCDIAGLDKKKLTRGGFGIRSGMISIGGVVNTGAITKPRVKLVILPLKAKGGAMAPCSVVALEE